jgi:hypothetical protein
MSRERDEQGSVALDATNVLESKGLNRLDLKPDGSSLLRSSGLDESVDLLEDL